MQNSEWDKHLREMLGDFRPGEDQPHWEEFARQLDARDTPSDPTDPIQDDQLHDTLVRYQPDSDVQGWDRIEASLDAGDKAFDENVRKKIHHYEPHFDPLAWPAFLKKFADHKLLRAKLIMLKVVEFAAVILLVFTVVHMGRLGKLPFETPLFDTPANPAEYSTHREDRADSGQQSGVGIEQLAVQNLDVTSKSPFGGFNDNPKVSSSPETVSGVTLKSPFGGFRGNPKDISSNEAVSGVTSKSPFGGFKDNPKDISSQEAVHSIQSEVGTAQLAVQSQTLVEQESVTSSESELAHSLSSEPPSAGFINESKQPKNDLSAETSHAYLTDRLNTDGAVGNVALDESPGITDYLAGVSPNLTFASGVVVPAVEFVKSKPGTFFEFSVLTQTDYNKLRMPEDRLYSAGKQIVFPVQGIPSHGFGAGFTIAIGHPIWALETGLIYSGKDFKPGRQLIVGGAFDNGSVEFEAMRLQVVSVPVQYRYRFERQGRLKAYALAGLAAHVIATSDIDVVIKYHFPSLAAGANPNHDPYFAQTIRETRRIREHIRDGAPFSTKSFFSANAGLGLEYSLTPNKTLFLQTTAQYQIPNLKFSNNNGKHIRTVSLQAGVRTPLGE